jgi:fatty acid desaturase
MLYGPRCYRIDQAELTELRELKPWKPALAAALNWVWIFAIVRGFLSFPEYCWYFYPVVIFLIAGRAGLFLQLAHEAGHNLISKGRFNDWFGNWMATHPLGLDLKSYREPHLRHHACVNQVCDPVSDREKYRICEIKNPRLWLLFLKDILGITAISIKFLYESPEANRFEHHIQDYLETEEGYTSYRPSNATSRLQSLKTLASIGLVQLLILAGIFWMNPIHYVLLWLVPLMTAHMVLMRVRGIAEHGLGLQVHAADLEEKSRGLYYTRSFGTPTNRYAFFPLIWLERALIGSLRVYYHHEHHLYPKVPYYNLHGIHALIAERVRTNNPNTYAKGYFACLFFRPKTTAPAPATTAA